MPKHVIECSQAASFAAGLSSSPAVFSTAIDGGITLGEGSTIKALSAYIKKPDGSELVESDSIELPTEIDIVLTPFVCFGGNPARKDNPALPTSGLVEVNGANMAENLERVWYLWKGSTKEIVRGRIPIKIPAGIYECVELASIISEQTRQTVYTQDGKQGYVITPSYVDLDDSSHPNLDKDVSGGDWALLQGWNYPPPGPDLGTEPYLGRNPSPDPIHDPFVRFTLGSTQGIDIIWNTTYRKFQFAAAHSPLYSSNPAQADDIIIAYGGDESQGPLHWYSIGLGGCLAFYSGSLGYPDEDSWDEGLWGRMGFDWNTLNPTLAPWHTHAVLEAGMSNPSTYPYGDQQGVPLPIEKLSDKSSGPFSAKLEPSSKTPIWLVECRLLPVEGSWSDGTGRKQGQIISIVDKTYSSGNYFSQSISPEWTLSSVTKKNFSGHIQIRLLDPTTRAPDDSLGDGSIVILEIDT